MVSLLIAFFLVSIVFSFLCSLWEAALLSITPAFAQIQLQEGSSVGRHLTEFKANIDRPLAAILTLNTIAHTVGAIGVGAQASIIWADANPLVTGLLVPAVMTLAILMLSEIIPKTLGALYWKQLAGFTVTSLLFIMTLLTPIIWACQLVTRLLTHNSEGSIFSRSDFMAMAEIGARDGVFEASESAMISNLLQFESVCVVDIMTPRTVVKALAEDCTIAESLNAHQPLQVSRIPIYQNGSKDDVTGYVLKDDLLHSMIEGHGEQKIADLRRDIMIVQENFPLPELFNRLMAKKEHIALVVDKFGGMAGIVTMEDAIETLLGREIVDESDCETDLRVQARRDWERRAKAQGLVEETYTVPAATLARSETESDSDTPDEKSPPPT
ncbi:HlyC/CorC family transporter [Halieaceae bacterium IMCC14734]|uniref:HlyC/CorC family transporter n=1 Tax=Candidatus Litorirhabdus singularis TaxID=2518993 RepID=A0ABT3TDV2_9GAMM|nr:hemolysin family protein [Candidatus Litorirhabdus singularis]MCX2980486.1 HlyC/CorC family transporter [Candidatus Litorirhabdus singularis]